MKRDRFAFAESVCAIDPRAYGEFYSAPGAPLVEKRDGVAVVNVRGPLMHHSESTCFDSYDAIKARVACAIAENPKAIVLSIDSPGGLVSGCFDTANEIAAMCEAAGVDLYAYVDGQACSAAYALACVADVVVIPPTGEAGSIGCISEMVSTAKIEAAMGIDRRIIASGDRKPDGNPNIPITDEAESAARAKVMYLAGLFAEHVAAHRPMKIAEVVAMQAGIVIGARAVPALADYVMGEDEMLAAISAGSFAAPAAGTTESKMPEDKSKASAAKAEGEDKENPFAKARKAYRASLGAIADDKDADEKDREEARKALKAMDPEEPDGDEASRAEHEEPDGDEPESKASKAISALVAKALAPVMQRIEAREASEAKARADADAAERQSLIDSRPDFDAATKAMCAKASLADLREYVKTAEVRKPKNPLTARAASAVVAGTRAKGQVDAKGTGSAPASTASGAPVEMHQPEADARAMRILMGTEKMPAHEVHIHENGNLTIGQTYRPSINDFDPRRRGVVQEPAA